MKHPTKKPRRERNRTSGARQQPRPLKPRSTVLPQVTSERLVETRSRGIFEAKVQPWLVRWDDRHDYGVDASVELTRPKGDVLEASGIRFGVQLKATEQDLSEDGFVAVVTTTNVRYWLACTEPIVLVGCHTPSARMWYRWIDDELVASLSRRAAGWYLQGTVSLTLSERVDDTTLRSLEQYARAPRSRVRRILEPGTYASLLERANASAATLYQLADGFSSVRQRLDDARNAIRQSAYVVAITGPARAGKSTLLNAIVREEISPVGMLPTTAVAILVSPGASPRSVIRFNDGTETSGPADTQFVASFATQEQNPENTKNVQSVNVELPNDVLEHGLRLADAPGLHDPDERIRAITERTLAHANAIIYVMDVSPAANGGFAFSQHHFDDLRRLKANADRLMLVFNKADALSENQTLLVREYAARELAKYGLLERLPVQPTFVSAQTAWDRRTARIAADPVQDLVEQLWRHLLSRGSTGLGRLSATIVECERAAQDLASILQARQLDGVKAQALATWLERARAKASELREECSRHQREDLQSAETEFEQARVQMLDALRDWLTNWPSQDLPSRSLVREQVYNSMVDALERTWFGIGSGMQTLALQLGAEVEITLQQGRQLAIPVGPAQFVAPSVPEFEATNALTSPETLGGVLVGGIFWAIAGNAAGALFMLGGLFAGLFIGKDARRKRDIERFVSQADRATSRAAPMLVAQMREKITSFHAALGQRLADRLTLFATDLRRQLNQLGEPISAEEEARLAEKLRQVRLQLEVVAKLRDELARVGP